MAIFSNKLVTAKFLDYPTNMIIEILYEAEKDKIIPYNLEVDFTDKDFNDLLEEITLDEIEKNTQKNLKAQTSVFDKIINDEIDRRWGIEQEKLKKAYEEAQGEFSELRKKLHEKYGEISHSPSEINGKDLLDIINSKDKDDDFIFNLKVTILEDPEIGKLKDKSLKLSIRKSKSVWELLKLYTNARF